MVEDRLREGWSPEQIAGRSRQQGLVLAGTEWISQHVRADRRAGGDLYRCLRRRGSKPNWHVGYSFMSAFDYNILNSAPLIATSVN